MGFKDELKEFSDEIIALQSLESREVIEDTDVLSALIVLNFIDYRKVPDVFWGCAALNLLSVYIKQEKSKINYQFRRHILNILKGIEDVNQPKSIRVSFDTSENLSLLIISFWDFQFSFQSQHLTDQIRRLEAKNALCWDGVRKQKCAKTIFEFARYNDWMSDSTMGKYSLRKLINEELDAFNDGGYVFDKGKLLKVKDLNPAKPDTDFHLKNYVRNKLYECQDRPVIISAVFKKAWEKHITFTSVKPYIANTRVITICDHINLYRPDVERVMNLSELQLGQRYYIIGYCKPYRNADRMGVQLVGDKPFKPIFGIMEFEKMPKDILAECHRFSIEEYLSKEQKKLKL